MLDNIVSYEALKRELLLILQRVICYESVAAITVEQLVFEHIRLSKIIYFKQNIFDDQKVTTSHSCNFEERYCNIYQNVLSLILLYSISYSYI